MNRPLKKIQEILFHGVFTKKMLYPMQKKFSRAILNQEVQMALLVDLGLELNRQGQIVT